jgi:hypothetical protein
MANPFEQKKPIKGEKPCPSCGGTGKKGSHQKSGD